MIRSMTGFAALSREENGDKVSVTIKSVNHRFLDVLLKAPQMLAPVEGRVKSLVQQPGHARPGRGADRRRGHGCSGA